MIHSIQYSQNHFSIVWGYWFSSGYHLASSQFTITGSPSNFPSDWAPPSPCFKALGRAIKIIPKPVASNNPSLPTELNLDPKHV